MNSRFTDSLQPAPPSGAHGLRPVPALAALRTVGRAPYDDTHIVVDGLDRDTLFAEFAPLVRRLIRQYGQTPEMRQELPGELYCRFQALLDSYDPGRGVPLRPYLVRQLTVGAYSFARKQWSQVRREAPLAEGMEGSVQLLALNPTEQWDTAIMQREIAASLPSMIAELPMRQRQVVVWRYYDEKSFEEMAGLLGVQESSVRSLLRHGMNRLRQRVTAN